MNLNRSGFFVSFEGGEGSGKTTVINKLKKDMEDGTFFCELNELAKFIEQYKKLSIHDFIEVKETSEYSKILKRLVLNNDFEPEIEMMLFSFIKLNMLRNDIIPALNNNQLVIVDRWIDSALVYQGIGRGLGIETVLQQQKDVLEAHGISVNYLFPDLTIYLDIDPEIGIERIVKNDRETNRFDHESLEFMNKIKAGFEQLIVEDRKNEKIEERRFAIINANDSIEEIYDKVKKTILVFIFAKAAVI